MSKLKKFEIFRKFFKDVVGFIFATFLLYLLMCTLFMVSVTQRML